MPTSRPSSARPKAPPLDATQRLALAKTLDAELCALERGRKESLAQMVTRLVRMKESRAYLSLGFASVQAYAWKRFEWGASKVKSLDLRSIPAEWTTRALAQAAALARSLRGWRGRTYGQFLRNGPRLCSPVARSSRSPSGRHTG